MPRIAVLAPRLYTFGGVTRVVTELVQRLSDVRGLDIDVITTRTKGSWPDRIDDSITKISQYPYPELSYFTPRTRKDLASYDLLWNHNLHLNRLASKIYVPFISTFHPPHNQFPGWASRSTTWKTKFDRYLNRRGIRHLQHADRVVAISDQTKDRLSEIHKAHAVRIYHGGNHASNPATLSERDEGFIFCPDRIDATIQRLADSYDVRAPGEGDDHNIAYLGNLDDEELFDIYEKASFIVSGSGKEGFGIAPVEAAFNGKPCVIRAIGGHKETIEHGRTGYLAENSKEFHEYVDKLWNNPEKREKMGCDAFERANDRYTWERAAREYLEEFNDFLETDLKMPD